MQDEMSSNILESWTAVILREKAVTPLRLAVEGYVRIEESKQVEPADLTPILDCARSHLRGRYEGASELLRRLVPEFKLVQDEIEVMAAESKAHIRHNAILCLSYTPRQFSLKLLKQGLSDRSTRVRKKASDWSLRLGLSELVPELERALSVETYQETRDELLLSLHLLLDGYMVENKDDEVLVTVRKLHGGISMSGIPHNQFSEESLRRKVYELQHRNIIDLSVF